MGPKDFQCSKAVQTIIASGKDQFFGTTIVPDLDLVQMCLFDKSGSTVKVLHCKDSQGGHTMGGPYPVCNNQLYTLIQPVSQPGSSDGLYVTDLSDLSEKKIADVETIIPYAVRSSLCIPKTRS